MKKITAILLAALMLFTACNNDMTGSGNLTVSLENRATRGIAPNQNAVYAYIRLTSNDFGQMYGEIGNGQTSTTITDIPAGVWTVYVEASDENGNSVGTATKQVTIIANRTVECSMSLSQDGQETGTGRVHLMVKNAPKGMHVKFYTVSESAGNVTENLAMDVFFQQGNSYYTENKITLDSGTYIMRFCYGDRVLLEDTVLVVAGKTTRFETYVIMDAVTGNLKVTITNNVVAVPEITFSGIGDTVAPGETYTVTADVKGMDNPAYTWLINETPVEGANTDTLTGTVPAEGGRMDITCRVASGNTVWSETKKLSVTDKSFAGHWLIKTLPEDELKEVFNVKMADGHMVYDRYGAEGRAMLGIESDYTIIQEGNDYRINFFWFGEDDPYHFTILNGDPSGEVILGFSPESDDCWVTMEAIESDPVYETVYIEYSETSHELVYSIPGYGLYPDDNGRREEHTFVDGVCSKCGYDQSSHLYDVCADPSVIKEEIKTVYPCIYWPGHLTLADGTVVNDADHFYFRKWFGGADNGYVLYIPYTVFEFYEQNGGKLGADNWVVTRWYIHNVLGFADWNEGCWNGMTKEVFDAFFTQDAKLKALDPAMVTDRDKVSSRTVVTDDPTVLPEGMEHWASWEFYTPNDLQLADGTPITEMNKAYLEESRNGYFTLWLPEEVNNEFDKGEGRNGWGGNNGWWYLRTYYPEEMKLQNQPGGWNTILTKVLQEYRKPSYTDVTNSYNDKRM